jgi:hypothetical protein
VEECQAIEQAACAEAQHVTRFLIDENLSVLLPKTAHARGYEATHINHCGLHQWNAIAYHQQVIATQKGVDRRFTNTPLSAARK